MPGSPGSNQERLFTPPRPSIGGGTAGSLLHERRLEYGWRLEDIAAALKIKREYLEALENDQVDALPGAAYAVGFMRAYGSFLDLTARKSPIFSSVRNRSLRAHLSSLSRSR